MPSRRGIACSSAVMSIAAASRMRRRRRRRTAATIVSGGDHPGRLVARDLAVQRGRSRARGSTRSSVADSPGSDLGGDEVGALDAEVVRHRAGVGDGDRAAGADRGRRQDDLELGELGGDRGHGDGAVPPPSPSSRSAKPTATMLPTRTRNAAPRTNSVHESRLMRYACTSRSSWSSRSSDPSGGAAGCGGSMVSVTDAPLRRRDRIGRTVLSGRVGLLDRRDRAGAPRSGGR